MNNHVHLLIQEETESVSQIMKRIGTSYAYWFNLKYERNGHLFQDRFKSENVEDDSYFLSVLRYIHHNPSKANVTKNNAYPWSSHRAYIGAVKCSKGLVDTDFALGMFGMEAQGALKKYMQYMEQETSVVHLDDKETRKATDSEVMSEIAKYLEDKPISMLGKMGIEERDEMLRRMKIVEGVSIRQLARVTGLGRNIIANA